MESTIFPTGERINRVLQGGDADMDNLSDDLLINILSCMSLKEAARTCVLAQRWKYLWRSWCGTLELDYENINYIMDVEKFESLVNTSLEVLQGRCIEGIVVSFGGIQEHYEMTQRLSHTIAIWMCAALHKEACEFPSVGMFRRLKTLRLVHVEIEDEVVHDLLASAPILEELCVSFSKVTKNLQVVGPPSLRILEIRECCNIQSVEISAVNLVSLTYIYGGGKDSLLLKKVPNLCHLVLCSEVAASYALDPKQESSYSAQLVELVFEIQPPASPTSSVAPPQLRVLTSA